MYYDHKEEYRKFMDEFDKQKKQMREAGMSEEDIAAVFEFDKDAFNRDRSFNRRKADYVEADDEEALAEKKKKNRFDKEPPREFAECLPLLDRMDGSVHSAFMTLGEKEKEVLLLRYEKGLSLYEIARFLGVPYQTLKKRHSRAIQKIKNIL